MMNLVVTLMMVKKTSKLKNRLMWNWKNSLLKTKMQIKRIKSNIRSKCNNNNKAVQASLVTRLVHLALHNNQILVRKNNKVRQVLAKRNQPEVDIDIIQFDCIYYIKKYFESNIEIYRYKLIIIDIRLTIIIVECTNCNKNLRHQV